MRLIKKIIAILLLAILIPLNVNAANYNSFDVISISDDEYKLNFFISSGFIASYNPNELIAYRGYTLDKYMVFWQPSTYKDEPLTGLFRWENPKYVIKDGEQTVNLLFDAMTGETIILEMYLYGVPNELEEKEARAEEEMKKNEEFPTTLTAESILLAMDSTYDINLNEKVSGSSYEWTSSNEKVAKVNKKNGFVTAVSEGKATITCKITTPDGVINELKSNVEVGQDDNFPVLTENILDLNIGDEFDINLENKIAKSKYKWSTSDRSVAKVNTANGKVTATGEGTANVYCTITTKNKEVIVLSCEVYVTK